MSKRFRGIFPLMALRCVAGGVGIAAVVSWFMPKVYESSLDVEIRSQLVWIKDLPEGFGVRVMAPQYMTGTEFDPVTSRHAFSEVIKRLHLMERWHVDQEAALRMMKSSVGKERLRDSDMFRITVRRPDAVEAAEIANGVVDVYREFRRDLGKRMEEEQFSALKKEIREQEDKVGERREVVTKISIARPMIYQESDLSIELRKQDYIDAKRDFETELALLEKMKLELLNMEMGRSIPWRDIIVTPDKAEVPDSPVSPNVTLNLILGAAGGLLIFPLLAFFAVRRMSAR